MLTQEVLVFLRKPSDVVDDIASVVSDHELGGVHLAGLLVVGV